MYEIRVYFDTSSNLQKDPRTYEELWNRAPQYAVKKVIFHPMYDHNRLDYDIAVLFLEGSVDSSVTPISLPSAGGKHLTSCNIM